MGEIFGLRFLECRVGGAGRKCLQFSNKGCFFVKGWLSLGWEEAGLPGKAQEMEGKGRAQVRGQLGPGAVTTHDKIGAVCELGW